MRDAYAMQLHSVPSRFSNRVHQTPTLKDVFGALFLLGNEVYYPGTEKVFPETAFNNYKNHTIEELVIT